MLKVIVWVFVVMGVTVMCEPPTPYRLDPKLVKNNDTICQITFHPYPNPNNLTINQCAGYQCSMRVGDRCLYFSYQDYSNSDCMWKCCGYNITNVEDNYSDALGYCLRMNQYMNQSSGFVPQRGSSNIGIILGVVIGGVFVIMVLVCVCCRKKIKLLFFPSHATNQVNPLSHNRVSNMLDNTLADINFIIENHSTQMHYEKQEQCTICLEQTNNCRTHCLHWYHLQCLMQWVKKGFRCPNCTNQEINPITVFCMECKRPYAEIKISKFTEGRQLQISLNAYKCKQCKDQKYG